MIKAKTSYPPDHTITFNNCSLFYQGKPIKLFQAPIACVEGCAISFDDNNHMVISSKTNEALRAAVIAIGQEYGWEATDKQPVNKKITQIKWNALYRLVMAPTQEERT